MVAVPIADIGAAAAAAAAAAATACSVGEPCMTLEEGESKANIMPCSIGEKGAAAILILRFLAASTGGGGGGGGGGRAADAVAAPARASCLV